MAIKLKQIVGAVVLAVSAIGAAQADSVTFTGFLGGRSATADINLPDNNNYSAGEFSIVLNGQSFSSLCVDITHHISFNTPQPYTDYTTKSASAYGFNSTQISLFNKLYTNYYSLSHANGENAAAFQIAVWEITYDGKGSLDLANGAYTMGGSGNNNAKGTANTWLNSLGNAQTGNWQFKVLDGKDHQDQLIAMPVPEPAEVAMLLAGLGLIGGVARRKARAAAAA